VVVSVAINSSRFRRMASAYCPAGNQLLAGLSCWLPFFSRLACLGWERLSWCALPVGVRHAVRGFACPAPSTVRYPLSSAALLYHLPGRFAAKAPPGSSDFGYSLARLAAAQSGRCSVRKAAAYSSMRSFVLVINEFPGPWGDNRIGAGLICLSSGAAWPEALAVAGCYSG